LFVDNPFSPALSQLHFDLKELRETLAQKKYQGRPAKRNWDETELSAYINRTASLALEAESFINQSSEDQVYWVELRKRRRIQPHIILKSAPINVSQSLKTLLFDRVKSAVLTSATLATTDLSLRTDTGAGQAGKYSPSAVPTQVSGRRTGHLGYLKSVLGLPGADEVILGSPFNYEKQVRIYLTRNLPDPNDKELFPPAVSERVLKYLTLTGGRAFVLFTSYELMNKVYERLYPELEQKGMVTYIQGRDLPRHKMLEEFKVKDGAVIFGADSFWQGVDVPGPALSNVIIIKLPFPVPSEPIVEAKVERMELAGLDSFTNYFLPEAIIKLRQGFGRLVRTKKDTGIVAILDNRILTKQYGRLFLESLPKCPVEVDD